MHVLRTESLFSSNTWPQPRPENFIDPDESGSNKCSNQQLSISKFSLDYFIITLFKFFLQSQFLDDPQQVTLPNITAQKKNSSRRNAWGNLSYADLITQAINSAVDNRLTLSQIYEWMVQNVPYFKDKGDSNSSAGWKVYMYKSLIIGAINFIFIHIHIHIYDS